MDYSFFFKNFLRGGLIIATIVYLAKNVSYELATIVWAFPITILTSAYLLYKANIGPFKVSLFGNNAVRASINKTIAIFLFTKIYENTNNIILSLILAFLAWGLGAVFIFRYF